MVHFTRVWSDFFNLFCYSYTKLLHLIDHLNSEHNYFIDVKKLQFSNYTSFLSWKDEEEKKTYSNYVQHSAPQVFSNKQHWYFYCNRSGEHHSQASGVRQLKSQGSCKIGERCAAHIRTTKDLLTDTVEVQYCNVHHNHEMSLALVRLSYDTHL